MYQLRPSPVTGISRIGVSEVLVVSWLVTSERRTMSLAPYQSCLRAASARWIEWAERSHITWSQYGSFTARIMRSLVGVPDGRAGSSLMGAGDAADGFPVLATSAFPEGVAADLADPFLVAVPRCKTLMGPCGVARLSGSFTFAASLPGRLAVTFAAALTVTRG